MKIWVNGVLQDPGEAKVSVFDHGFTVGDGVFETVKVVDGVPFALQRHLDRLVRSARGLGLGAPDQGAVRSAVEQVLESGEPAGLWRLRITFTGGPAPLGSDRGDAQTTLVVAAAPMDPPAPTTKIAVVPWRRNEFGATAGLKSTSYADNVIALAEAHRRGASEAVFANTSGLLCEGTGSNVFVVIGDRVFTPPLASGCLAGVTRALVLEWYGAEEVDLPIPVLDEAEEIFLTSSTRDVQAVAAVDDRTISVAPGPKTREIQEVFAQRSKESTDP